MMINHLILTRGCWILIKNRRMNLLKNVKVPHILFVLFSLFLFSLFYTLRAGTTGDEKVDATSTMSRAVKVVVLDPGHGGKLPGARGALSAEKDIVLDVSKKLKNAIENEIPGVKVLLTRDEDIDVPIYERGRFANRHNADLFISIHCNSANSERKVKGRNGRYTTQIVRRPNVKGTETFVCGYNRLGEQDVAIRENADILLEENYKENYNGFDPSDVSTYIVFSLMRRQFRDQSIKLASYMQEEFVSSGRANRGVQELSLGVLAVAGMPAVLTEIGFISNPEEERFMLSEKGQEEIVNNLMIAVKRFKTSMEQ